MCRQRFILKRKAFIALFIGIFILSGCRQSENSKIDSDTFLPETVDNHVKKEETDTKFTEIESKAKDDEKNESAEDLPKPLEVPVNTKAEDIHYYAEDYVDLLASPPLCKSDGKNIYLVNKQDFYIIPVGTDELSPANIDIPEGMDVYNLALDSYGRIHLLIVDRDKQQYFIWRFDKNYQVDKMIDISAYVEEKQVPLWFLIHKDGTYYIQWLLNRNGIIVDSDGVLKHKFTLESLGIKWTREAAVGKDGQIYLVYGDRDEKWEIGKLNLKDCSIENSNPSIYFPGSEIFMAMSGGTDTNLLLMSPYSGVWACDTESGIIENRVPLSDLRLGFDTESEFWLRMFLPDGRLFLLGQAVNDDNVDDADGESSKHLLFRYIPVGK